MASTKTVVESLAGVLDLADPDKLADALSQIKLGTMLSPLKATVVGATSSATQNITTIPAAQVTINQGSPAVVAAGTLPPILAVISLRVTAGTLAAGPAIVTDVGGTPTAIGAGTASVATLSDDGTTLVFQAAVTAFVIEYIPRPGAKVKAGAFTQVGMTGAFTR